jgi:PKD repeat protein
MKHLLTFLTIIAGFYANSQVAAITSPDQTICACENAILSSATSTPGNSPIVRTIWSVLGPNGFNAADTTNVGTNLSIQLCTPGSYDISIINQHQNGTTSSAQAFGFITVNSNPTASLSASINSCQFPFGVTYTNNAPVAGVTAAWTFQGGNPGSFNGDTPPLIGYATAGTYNVQLIATNTLTGCRDTASQAVVVSDFDAGIILPTAPLCENELLQFTDNSTIGANSFNWTFENGTPGTASGPNPTASFPVGTHTITLQSSSANGCNGIATAQITVVAKPIPSFTVDPVIGCAPMATTFTNTSGPGTTFVWSYGDGTPNFTGQNSPVHTYTGNGIYTPALTMTGTNGCTATVSGSPITLTSPIANFTKVENNTCEPKNVTFDPSPSTAPGAIVTWTWDFGDGTAILVNTTGVPVSHDYFCGEYIPSLVIAMANGCRDTVLGDVKVGTPLNVGFEADTILRCIKKPIMLHSTTVIDCEHEDDDIIYTWYYENQPEVGDSAQTKVFTDTLQNAGYAIDTKLELDFRGCKSVDSIIDYIYIKAPVSRFSIDTLRFCTPGFQPGPLAKMVTVNDMASIYGCFGPINHNLTPNGPMTLVPNQPADDVVVTYKWDDGTTDVIEDDTQLEFPDPDKGAITHTYNNYGTYSVWQIIENRSTGCIDSTTTTVNVSWVETEFIFDIAGNDSVCVNTPFTLTTTSGTHGVPITVPETHAPLTYSFNMIVGPLSGSGSTEDQTFNYTYFVPGDYNVSLTTTNSVGCFATHTDHITVFGLPVADFALSDVNGCIGITYPTSTTNNSSHPAGTFGFGNNTTGWAANDAFHWTISPNGGTTTTQITDAYSDVVSTTVSNTTTISLFVIDGFGCQSSSVNVTANVNKPTAGFPLAATGCDGTGGVLDGSIETSGTQPMTYQWFTDTNPNGLPEGASIGSGAQQPYTLTSTGLSQVHEYCLIVQDGTPDQCPDTICKTVTVSKPVAQFDDVQSGSSVDVNGNFTCPPVVVNFTNTSLTSNSIQSFNWYLDLNPSQDTLWDILTSTQASPTGIQYQFAGTYDLAFVVVDAVGCRDSVFIDNYLEIQGPSGEPSITTVLNDCGQTFTFDITNTENMARWEWHLGDGTVVSSADSTLPFTYTYTGVQSYFPEVFLYDAIECEVDYDDTATIIPNGVTAQFTISPDEVSLGTVVTFTETSTAVNGVAMWIWDYGNGNIDTLFPPGNGNTTQQYTIGGDIPVTLKVVENLTGCTDDVTLTLTVDVKLIVPNVFTGSGSDGPNADLLLFADVFNDFDITIVNRWGNVVYEGKRDATKPRYLWNGIDQKSGKLCQDGTYFYLLKGILKNDVAVDLNGFVTLIGSTRP